MILSDTGLKLLLWFPSAWTCNEERYKPQMLSSPLKRWEPLCQGYIYRVLLKIPVVGMSGLCAPPRLPRGVEGNWAVRSKGEDATFGFSAAVLLGHHCRVQCLSELLLGQPGTKHTSLILHLSFQGHEGRELFFHLWKQLSLINIWKCIKDQK